MRRRLCLMKNESSEDGAGGGIRTRDIPVWKTGAIGHYATPALVEAVGFEPTIFCFEGRCLKSIWLDLHADRNWYAEPDSNGA